ncbi:MAG: glycosyltransferase family 2 protein [Bacteroidia bacterium]|jgi:dolichol-phosphate mannosyltransferase|nr:glycosyltransferase family 2 protein [Bacteroidia bacterium]
MIRELSIVAPVFNEEANIELLFNRLHQVLQNQNYEVIFVNDGSADQSLIEIKKLASNHAQIKYLSFSRNFGHQLAVFAGLQKAKGNYVVIIDADLQDPPELIHDMLAKAKEGYDVVYAKRLNRKGESFFKRITAKWFYRLMRAVTSINIPLDTGDFRIMTQRVCKIVTSMPEKNKFLRGQISWIGFKQTYVEYERDPRIYGETGYTLKKMINFAIDGITAFSHFPIRLVTYIGLSMAFLSSIAIAYALYSKFIAGETVKGWTSMFILFTLIGGTQLFCMGIIGEYISRIMNNVLQRPDYLIDESNIDD